MIELKDLPKLPQRQDSLAAQLADLRYVANRLGLYDAADALRRQFGDTMSKAENQVRYGCHCGLEDRMEPGGCVIDEGRPQDCVYAAKALRERAAAEPELIEKPLAAGETLESEWVSTDSFYGNE